MPWIELTADNVSTRLSGPEMAALTTAALGSGQGDPLPDIVAQVTNEVRGYIATNKANRLAAGNTIPDKLESAALAMIRFRMIERLPDTGLMTDARMKSNSSAETLMRDVAAGRFTVDEPEPDQVSTERVPSPRPVIADKCRRFGGRYEEGT